MGKVGEVWDKGQEVGEFYEGEGVCVVMLSFSVYGIF